MSSLLHCPLVSLLLSTGSDSRFPGATYRLCDTCVCYHIMKTLEKCPERALLCVFQARQIPIYLPFQYMCTPGQMKANIAF